jgi:GAF domain-containing protein
MTTATNGVRPVDPAAELLADLALAVSADVRLDEVLSQVVSATRRILQADRATLLLLDDDGRLTPAVSLGAQSDQQLWKRFRSMRPITLDLTPAVLDLLREGRAVVVDDARGSPIVPDEWQATFGLESLAAVALRARGELCGLLVVDQRAQTTGFSAEERHLLEGIAAFAATAVSHAADYRAAQRRSRSLDRILSVASALNAAPGLAAVVATALDALLDVLGARSCALHLFDDERSVLTLGARGAEQPAAGRHRLGDGEAELLRRLGPEPITIDAALPAGISPQAPHPAPSAVLAVRRPDGEPGLVVVAGTDGTPLRPEQARLAVSVAEQVWLAVERALLAEERDCRMEQVETLHQLADELALAPSMAVMLDRLAPVVRRSGVELIDVQLRDRRAARVWGCSSTRGEVSRLVTRWQRQRRPRPVCDGGLLAVPLLFEGNVAGAMRVRPVSTVPPPARDQDFLLSIGTGLAQLVARLVLAARVSDSERELAVTAERERIATELHATVGRLLVVSGERLRTLTASASSPGLRAQLGEVWTTVNQTRNHVAQAVEALNAPHDLRQTLAGRLREIVRSMAVDGSLVVDVRVEGRPRPLSPAAEGALFRVAHEALRTLQRQAHSSTVVVRLCYEPDAVRLLVRDDGLSLLQRSESEAGLHVGLPALRRRAREVGGEVELSSSGRQGLRLAVMVPAPRAVPV